jgi:DNA-binding transcriptional regulator YdaS (Cro superfamily)
MDHLREYLSAERGRQAKLAAALGISQSAISMWTRVPAERVASISAHTGLSRQVLRPDIFGPYENIQRPEYVQNAAVTK